MRSLLLSIAFLCGTTPTQTTWIVDASGAVGNFRRVDAAVQAATSGDTILIHPGTYLGTIDLQGKGLALIGVTGKAYDVIIRSSAPQGTVFLARSLNPGLTIRLSSMTFDSGGNPLGGVVVANGSGDAYFENIWSGQSWYVANWTGTISLARCLVRVGNPTTTTPPSYSLEFDRVRHVFIRDSVVESNFASSLFAPTLGVSLKSCFAELLQTSITGPFGRQNGSRISGDGGTGLSLVFSSVRISGDGTDIISGGASTNWSNTTGGFGITLQGSTLQWSGTQVRGGAAVGSGNPGRPFFVGPFSKSANVQPAFPRLRPRSEMARGRLSTVDIHASPNALSLTWLSTAVRPVPTPLGVLALDLGQPVIELLLSHDSLGAASFPMDLRQLPVGFTGKHFGMQTLAVTPAHAVRLSTPFLQILR